MSEVQNWQNKKKMKKELIKKIRKSKKDNPHYCMRKKETLSKEIEDVLDEQFPKGECKERGNALVLHAQTIIKFEEKIQNAQRRIEDSMNLIFKINEEDGLKSEISKELIKEILDICDGIKYEINKINKKIFKEEFGEELI